MRHLKVWSKSVAVAALVVISACSTPASPTPDARDYVRYASGAFASCSAVVIKPNLAATAAHCVNEVSKVDGLSVTDVLVVPNTDRAYLKVPGLQCPCVAVPHKDAALAIDQSFIGQSVKVIGYPLGNAFDPPIKVVTVGVVKAYAHIWDDFRVHKEPGYLAEVAVIGGMSGGGVFLTQNGVDVLIGVISRGGGNFLFFVPVNHNELAQAEELFKRSYD